MGAFKQQQVEMMECPACDGGGSQRKSVRWGHEPDEIDCVACGGSGEVEVGYSGPWTEAEAREIGEEVRADAKYHEMKEEGLI